MCLVQHGVKDVGKFPDDVWQHVRGVNTEVMLRPNRLHVGDIQEIRHAQITPHSPIVFRDTFLKVFSCFNGLPM
jgi:hypothetical protein